MKSPRKVLRHAPTVLPLLPKTGYRLEKLAQGLVQKTVAEFEAYRERNNRQVDTKFWSPVQQVDHMFIYKDHKKLRQNPRMLQTSEGRATPINARTSVPKFLLVGRVPGKMDDCVYGALATTDEAVKIRSTYIHDNLLNFRWLAKVDTPTAENPFHFTGIAWSMLGSYGIPLVNYRDYCVLISMGVTKGSDGKPIGYYLVHSVDLVNDLEKHGLVRAKGSLCFLRRQLDANSVELYQTGFFAPMGIASEMTMTRAVTSAFLAATQTAEVSYSKKLFWMMQRALSRRSNNQEQNRRNCAGKCGFGKSSSRHGSCITCHQAVCSSCKVRRRITLRLSPGVLKQKRFTFCQYCILKAKTTDVTAFARRELRDKTLSFDDDLDDHFGTFLQLSSSSESSYSTF